MAKNNLTKAPKIQSEKDFQAQDDARHLSHAAAIKKDPARLKAAKQAAKQMAVEHEERAKEIKTYAKEYKRLAKTG